MTQHSYSNNSILNRLIDLEPLNNEAHHQTFTSFREVEEMVTRDLENLLNSRRSMVAIPGNCQNLQKSVLAYGLRDYCAENTKSPMIQQQLAREISKAIATFEPRLANVSVQVASGASGPGLHLVINATLNVAPFKNHILFNTVFDSSKDKFIIES